MDSEISELADSIYREKVLRARATPPSKKMGWGPEMFAEACARMRSGIRTQFPEADDSEVARILLERLEKLDRLEEVGIFAPVPVAS